MTAFVMTSLILLAVSLDPTLSAVYIICLIVGGGLVFISTVFGSHADGGVDLDTDLGVDLDTGADLDVDTGVGMDVDAGMDADFEVDASGDLAGHPVGHDVATPADTSAVSLASWFSVQFVVYFLAMFGLLGTVLTYVTRFDVIPTLIISSAGGLVVGQGVHQLLRYLRKTSGDSAATPADYANRLAIVTMAIEPAQAGEVAVVIRGQTRFLPAKARRPDDRFDRNDAVVVVAYHNGAAEVLSRKEYEFLTDSEAV